MIRKQTVCMSCLHHVGDHDEWGCALCDCLEQYIMNKENN